MSSKEEERYLFCQLIIICDCILDSYKVYTSSDYHLDVMISKYPEDEDIGEKQAVESRLALKKAAERLIISFGEGTVDIERVEEELKTIENESLALSEEARLATQATQATQKE